MTTNGAAKREQDSGADALASILARSPQIRRVGLLTAEDGARAAAQRITYEWEGIACDGNIVALVGHPGEGKTTLLYAMLAARARTTDGPAVVLGRELRAAPRGKVLVLVQEEIAGKLSERKLDEALALWGMPASAKDGRILRLPQSGAKLDDPLWREIVALTKAGLVDSIWIDSLARVQPVDSDAEEDQAKVFAYLQSIASGSPAERKPTIWLTAHARKGATGTSITDISGSHQRGAQIDVGVWVSLERDGNRIAGSRSSFLKIRDAEGDYPEPCSFSIARRASGEVAATWSTSQGEVGRAPIAKAEVLDVFARMRERGVDGLTVSAVCRELAKARGSTSTNAKADARTVRPLLDALVGDRELSRCKIEQRRGDPFDGFRLGAEGGTVAGAVPGAASFEDL